VRGSITTVLPLLLLVSALLSTGQALAAPPPNDNYANATVITTLPFTESVDMSQATGEPAHGETATQRTVWYQYTPATAQRVETTTLGSQSWTSTQLCVEGGPCAGSFAVCGLGRYGPRIVLDLEPGRTYHLQVRSTAQIAVFNLLAPPPPANDEIGQATVIGALPFTDSIHTATATRSAGDPSGACFSGLSNVWYQFTPPFDMFITVDMLPSDYPVQWTILSETGGVLATVDCGSCTILPPVRLTGGVTYFIMVEALIVQGPGGNLQFAMDGVAALPAPANDDFDGATEIDALPFLNSMNILSSTVAADDPPSCTPPLGSRTTLWYRFTPPEDVVVAPNTSGGDFVEPRVNIFTGSRGALTLVNPGCPLSTALTGGVTYHLMVTATGALRLPGTLHFGLDVFQPPRAAVKVFGQPNFTSNSINSGGLSSGSLRAPTGVVVDPSGEHLYVADRGNHRVLEYTSPATGDTIADHVFGQTDASGTSSFTTGTANIGGTISARGLNAPTEVALAAGGDLFVTEIGNNRVMRYDSPLTTDAIADIVFGQPDFSTGTVNTGGRSEFSLATPTGVAVDADGNLYVGEAGNTRAVRYDAPLFSSDDADLLFGEPDFSSADTPGTNASSLGSVTDVTLDQAGKLYVGDFSAARILRFSPPFVGDPPAADQVIGKPDFTAPKVEDCLQGIDVSAASLCSPRGIATDCAGNVYVADDSHMRVVIYRDPVATDTVADEVLGRYNFTSGGSNWEGTSARTLSSPRSVAVDGAGHLYVSDSTNNRVLMFDPIDMDDDGLTGSLDACLCDAPSLGLDADHNGCTDTLPGLRAIVDGLPIASNLKNVLLGKLDDAQKALDRNSPRTAVMKLQAFVNQVESQSGKGISEADASLLVDYAGNLIALISASG
jgi:sugar lactone lactonase YvrE